MSAGKNVGSLERILLLHIGMSAFAWVGTQGCPCLETSFVYITYPLLLCLLWIGVLKAQHCVHTAG